MQIFQVAIHYNIRGFQNSLGQDLASLKSHAGCHELEVTLCCPLEAVL